MTFCVDPDLDPRIRIPLMNGSGFDSDPDPDTDPDPDIFVIDLQDDNK
jgi:hypothetical protein